VGTALAPPGHAHPGSASQPCEEVACLALALACPPDRSLHESWA